MSLLFRDTQASYLPVDVLAGAKAEAVAKRARSARIRCIMVAESGDCGCKERRHESNYRRRRLYSGYGSAKDCEFNLMA